MPQGVGVSSVGVWVWVCGGVGGVWGVGGGYIGLEYSTSIHTLLLT